MRRIALVWVAGLLVTAFVGAPLSAPLVPDDQQTAREVVARQDVACAAGIGAALEPAALEEEQVAKVEAKQPAPVEPTVAEIYLPKITSPSPAPSPPAPGTPAKLTANVLYVVESESPFISLASPTGYLTYSQETGPLKIRAVFIDSAGKSETRTYARKHIIVIEAAGTGRCEVLFIPNGATLASQVKRQTLDVDNGTPPTPVPPTPVPPDPPTPVDPLTQAFQVAYNMETVEVAQKPARLAKLASLMQQASTQVQDAKYTTTKQFVDEIHAATELLIGAGALMQTRGAVGTYLNSNLPKTSVPLDTMMRQKVSLAYLTAAQALKGVKP